MSRDLEIEAKYLVSQADFYTLLTYFKISSKDFKIQTNYYLDNKNLDLIKKFHYVFRVRNKGGQKWEATLKIPNHGSLTEINQKNIIFDLNTFDLSVLKEILPEIEKCGVHPKDIQIQGILQTNRAEIPYLGGILAFDISSYNNVVDYEIEYEVSSTIEESHAILQKLFLETKIHSVQPSTPKIKRCLNLKD